MAENKFIKHLKGTETAGSVLEIKNQGTPATFGNMPAGTSNPNTVYADARGDATGVLKGTDNWKLDGSTLTLATQVYGDGRDLTGTYTASGNTLWVNGVYTFGSAKIFSPNTKWVLKLCGSNLLSGSSDTIDFSLIIKFGSTAVVAKNFTVAEQANNFCQQFVIDFNEWTQNVIKAVSGDTMTIQLLCGDSTASATIYNGMTTLTALQRRVDGDVVASDTSTFDDLEQGLAGKVDKVSTPSVVYGTDATGAQTTYDLDELGGVTDVQIDGVSIVQDKIANIPMSTYLGDYVLKAGDTMSGTLEMLNAPVKLRNSTYNQDYYLQSGSSGGLRIGKSATASNNDLFITTGTGNQRRIAFGNADGGTIGSPTAKFQIVYANNINNGYDIAVPVTNSADTLALKSQVDDAANSGDQLTAKGVWYAKMYAATVPPSADNGTNYADFSQVDGNGDPIIVIYERQSGAWVQTDTITPPASYNGYVTVTSKIWDIAEQTGQQGGKVLWSHNQKTFTPYPQIISFEDAALTGNSTVAMPLSPTNDNITNKGYVDSAIAGAISSVSGWDLFDFKWKDCTLTRAGWALSDGNWIDDAPTAYQHLADDVDTAETIYLWEYLALDLSDEPQTIYLTSSIPTVGDDVYDSTGLKIGTVTSTTGAVCAYNNGSAEYAEHSEAGYVHVRESETIAGTTVEYYLAADGHKICLPDQETNIDAIYAATGVAWYYVLDTANQRFKLPQKTSQQIVRSVLNSDGSWYKLYANGWIEQGGRIGLNITSVTLPVEMSDSDYQCIVTYRKLSGNTNTPQFQNIGTLTQTTTGFTVLTAATYYRNWRVVGLSALDTTNEQDDQKYLYFYIGA